MTPRQFLFRICSSVILQAGAKLSVILYIFHHITCAFLNQLPLQKVQLLVPDVLIEPVD